MLASINDALAWLGKILAGPFGGLIGGAISFLALELGLKRRRERHDIAEAIAAELANAADGIQSFLDDQERNEIPPYYRTSHVVFDALAGKLGKLPFDDVVAITKLYHFLDECNRLPDAWRERAANAYQLPVGHPFRVDEEKALKEGVDSFYGMLPRLRGDCIGLASHLRTTHATGWRGILPLPIRPQVSLSAPKKKADG